MSNNNSLPALTQEVLTYYSPSLTGNYIYLASAVLVLYDYVLLLPLEISEIWVAKFSVYKALFLVNRYFSLLAEFSSLFIYLYYPASNTECDAFDYFSSTLYILVSVAVNGIFILRTFAIFNKNRFILIVLIIPTAISIAAMIWDLISQWYYAPPVQLQIGPNTCLTTLSPSSYTSGVLNYAMNIVFDGLVVFLTVFRLARTAIQSKRVKTRSLSVIYIRDGLYYYVLLFLPTIALVITGILLVHSSSESTYLLLAVNNVASIINVLQVIATNRLVLSLRSEAKVDNSRSTMYSEQGPIVFEADKSQESNTPSERAHVDGNSEEIQPSTQNGIDIIEASGSSMA